MTSSNATGGTTRGTTGNASRGGTGVGATGGMNRAATGGTSLPGTGGTTGNAPRGGTGVGATGGTSLPGTGGTTGSASRSASGVGATGGSNRGATGGTSLPGTGGTTGSAPRSATGVGATGSGDMAGSATGTGVTRTGKPTGSTIGRTTGSVTSATGSTTSATGTVEIPAAGAYRIEPGESTVSFATRHMFGLAPVRGTFALRDGVVHVADPVGSSSVRATIDAGSVDTGLAARDTAVRSKQYLDAAAHPGITFAATNVTRDDDGWVLRGTLTVRGRTEPLDVRVEEVRVLDGSLRLRASAEVDRYAWGVTAMKGMTGRRLRFSLSLSATQVAIA